MKYVFLLLMVNWSFSFSQTNSVMSYNIKLDYPKEGPNSWENRKPFFINLIKFYEPDVLGVQEAMPNQMKDMNRFLLDYDHVGVGRDDGKNEGEYTAIFYKKYALKIIKAATFWLSETPEKVSMGWDAACHRICTYALFQNKTTKKFFWVFNTHFDHVGAIARKNSTRLVLEKIQSLNTKHYPVVLTGDFNLEPDSEPITTLSSILIDSKKIAPVVFGPEGTFNGFHFDKSSTRRIDYIFVNKAVTVLKYGVLSDNWDLKYPSDHFPVMIQFRI